jgi:hypothetical protein
MSRCRAVSRQPSALSALSRSAKPTPILGTKVCASLFAFPRRQPCEALSLSSWRCSASPRPLLQPMPARGARTTAVASRTAAILHTRSALRRCKGWQDTVRRTPSREPRMGHQLEVGAAGRHPGVIGGPISTKAHIAAAPAESVIIAAEPGRTRAIMSSGPANAGGWNGANFPGAPDVPISEAALQGRAHQGRPSLRGDLQLKRLQNRLRISAGALRHYLEG